MDKKRTIRIVTAVCFTIVCGILYLVFCSPFGRSDEIVFEKQPEVLQEEAEKELCSAEATENGDDETNDGNEFLESEETGNIYVHICGAVSEAGVYGLAFGSRVTDGIEAAGGFCEDADVTYHNLAALLRDGQKIYVPTLAETQALTLPERTEDGNVGSSESVGKAEVGTIKKVNLNTADVTELMTLSGIGEAKAEGIIQYREKVGRFQRIEDVKNVSGIGDAMFERIQNDIIVE